MAEEKQLLTEEKKPQTDMIGQPTEEVLFKQLCDTILKYHPSTDLSLIEKVYETAKNAHGKQIRKSGEPYIIHPLSVAIILAELEMDKETIVAGILHDVVEDTDMTFEDLERAGFPEEVITALKCLTHEDDVPYLGAYIEGIKANPLARKVKLADLSHNLDSTRLPPAKNEYERSNREQHVKKYQAAKTFLETE